MKNTTKISLVLTWAMFLQVLGGGLAFADGPSGTITYNGQDIQVTNGQFMLNGVAGTIDGNGNYSWNGTVANLLNTPGVTSYQVTGQAVVPVTVVAPVHKWPTGTVTYNGQSIQVTNGQFTLNGKIGTIDDNGTVVYDGQTKNLKEIQWVTGYQVQGQAFVPVDSSAHRTVEGANRYGAHSKVDIDFLAQTMKDGTFNVSNVFTKNYASALGFSDADIKAFQDFVGSHTAREIADRIATFPADAVLKLDEMRPTSSPGIAWRVDSNTLARYLISVPEAWQNVLEYAGIPVTKADLDKTYGSTKEDIAAWLSTLSNDKFEKVQAYAYNSFDMAAVKPFFASGWDDKSAYDPEMGRVVTPAEKDAIKRIKDFTTLSVFLTDPGHDILSPIGKTKRIVDGAYAYWKPGAFKEYLTEDAIKDFIAHPDKGVFAGGSNGSITFKDGTVSNGGTTTSGAVKSSTTEIVWRNNPYTSSFSPANVIALDNWIATKVTAKESTMTPTAYAAFIAKLSAKIDTLKSTITNQTKLNILNYIQYEISNTSFLDGLVN